MQETIEINSFIHFIKLLEDDTQFDRENKLNGITLYRGQNCDLPLLPKIGHIGNPVTEILDIEATILNEFEKRCFQFLGFEPDNEWDLITLAQHHGLPTRLLDWSENPLVALWFAVSHENKDKTDGVVWGFEVEDDHIVSDLEKNPLETKKTKVFDPTHINNRITNQAAWVTVHKLTDSNKRTILPLEQQEEYKGALRKLIIPQYLFKGFRHKLNKMGINNATIFPDLDGLCKHLSWKYLG